MQVQIDPENVLYVQARGGSAQVLFFNPEINQLQTAVTKGPTEGLLASFGFPHVYSAEGDIGFSVNFDRVEHIAQADNRVDNSAQGGQKINIHVDFGAQGARGQYRFASLFGEFPAGGGTNLIFKEAGGKKIFLLTPYSRTTIDEMCKLMPARDTASLERKGPPRGTDYV